jgi:shikimate kinase / 3-dehydroquinate synthase
VAARGIYLIGFSGTGKSTIAQAVGSELGWLVFDLDDVIVERSGMTIPVIFEREGETGFRLREAEALRAVSGIAPFVVATGGGAAVRVENRRLMASKGWIIALEGRPEALNARIQRQLQQAAPGAIRPMLDAVYPIDQIRALKHSRQSVYALADWTVHTDRLTPQQVAAEVVRAVKILETTGDPPAAFDVPATPLRHSLNPDRPPPVLVAAGPWPYQSVVGWDHLSALGEQVRRLFPHSRYAAILTGSGTWARLGEAVRRTLQAVGLEIHVRETACDERVKTLEEASAIYDWLLDLKVRRDDLLLVVGGGAVDDLGSFVASTYMRGIPLVKVPTSLEGMVDTSIGGKTALNHPRARNLIGTFYHPRLAWSDVSLVRQEPAREVRAAFAEIVKYAMLEGSLMPHETIGVTMLDQLERGADALKALERQTLTQTVARCVALKAQVVSADERDLGQFRILLNYGHTVGHALETATDYALPHGEAVAIGMAVEARLAVRLHLADASLERRLDELLTRLELPTRLPRVTHDRLLELVQRDKKVFGDAPRWILPTTAGRAVVSRNVPEEEVVAALRERS